MKLWKNIATLAAVLTLAVAAPQRASAQFYAVYGNALMLATGTVNAGINVGMSSKVSFDFSVMLNPIKTPKFSTQFAMIQPGFRFWLSEIQYGNFFGVHLFAGVYDVGNSEFHTRGYTAGIGISWGYNWLITKRFNIGVEIGGGVGFMQDRHENHYTPPLDDHYIYHATRLAVLPTKLAVNLIYLF